MTTGGGLVVLVNRSSGRLWGRDPRPALEAALPDAELVTVRNGGELARELPRAAGRAAVLGVAGGDGSVTAGAGVAHRAGLPYVAVPGGTRNHFTRDLGIDTVAAAAEAVRSGATVAVDVGQVAGRPFLSAASMGSYVDVVRRRNRLERHLGRWPAALVALVWVLARGRPLDLVVDGRERRVWALFVTTCHHLPGGIGPRSQGRVGGGRLVVRVVPAGRRWSRARFLGGCLLQRPDAGAERWVTTQVRIEVPDGPATLAADGELFPAPASFSIDVLERPLVVHAPGV